MPTPTAIQEHTYTPAGPGAAVREEGVEEEEEVAGDLLDDVQKPEVPGHVDPKQLVLRTGFLFFEKSNSSNLKGR